MQKKKFAKKEAFFDGNEINYSIKSQMLFGIFCQLRTRLIFLWSDEGGRARVPPLRLPFRLLLSAEATLEVALAAAVEAEAGMVEAAPADLALLFFLSTLMLLLW